MPNSELTALLRFKVEGAQLDALRAQLLKLKSLHKDVSKDAEDLAARARQVQAVYEHLSSVGIKGTVLEGWKGNVNRIEAELRDVAKTINTIEDAQYQVNEAIKTATRLIREKTGEYRQAARSAVAMAASETKQARQLTGGVPDLLEFDTESASLLQLNNAVRQAEDALSRMTNDAKQTEDQIARLEKTTLSYIQAVRENRALWSAGVGADFAQALGRLRETYLHLSNAIDALKNKQEELLDAQAQARTAETMRRAAEEAKRRAEAERQAAEAAKKAGETQEDTVSEQQIKRITISRDLYEAIADTLSDVQGEAKRTAEALRALGQLRTPDHQARLAQGDPVAQQIEQQYQAMLRLTNAAEELQRIYQNIVTEGAAAYMNAEKTFEIDIEAPTAEALSNFKALFEEAQYTSEEMGRLNVGAKKFSDVVGEIAKRWQALGDVMEGTQQALIDPQKRAAMMRREAYEYGRTGMAFRAIGRGAARILGVQTIEPIFAAGDIIRGIRGIKLLQAEIPVITGRIRDNAEAFIEVSKATSAAAESSSALARVYSTLKIKAAAATLSTTGLVTALGAAAAAVAIAVAIIQQFRKQGKEQGEIIKNFMEANQQYTEALSAATTQEVQNAIDEQLAKQSRLKEERALLKLLLDEVEATGGLVGAFFDLADALGYNYANLEDARDRYKELGGEIDVSTSMVNRLTDALGQLRTMGADFIELIEQFPGGAITATQEEFAALASGKIQAPLVKFITTEEAALEAAMTAAFIKAMEEERARQEAFKETAAPPQAVAAEIRIEELDTRISEAKDKWRDLIAYVMSGTSAIVDEWEKRQVDFEFDKQAGQRAIAYAQSLNQLLAEIQEMARDPGTPEEVARQIDSLNLQIQAQRQLLGDLNTLYDQGKIKYAEWLQATTEANKNIGLMEYQVKLLSNAVVPAAEAMELFNKAVERHNELREQAIEWIERENQLRMEAVSRAFFADDPQGVTEDIQRIQLEIAGWARHLASLDTRLAAGILTQEEYDKMATRTAVTIRELSMEMRLLQNEVLPAAQDMKRFTDQLDLWIAQIKLAEEQARVDAERALQLRRDQEDFERRRARDIAQHYADLARLDAKLAEDIQKELEQQHESLDDQRKKELDEEAKHQKEMQRLAEDHRRKLLEISRDLSAGLGEAVEERSVTAAIEAIRRAREETEDEEYRYQTEKRRREEDFRDRMAKLAEERQERKLDYERHIQELREQHARERAERIAAFQQRLAEEDEERQIAAQRRKEDWEREDQERRDHYMKIEQNTRQHYINLHRQAQLGMMGIETEVANAWTRINNYFSTVQQQFQQQLAQAQAQAQAHLQQMQQQQLATIQYQQRIMQQQQQLQRMMVSPQAAAALTTFRFRMPALFGTGTDRVPPGEWVILGDTGPEMARFHRDGRWEVLNPRRTEQALRGGGAAHLTVSMPVAIYDASNPVEIERIFDSKILPKIVRQFERVAKAPRGRYY